MTFEEHGQNVPAPNKIYELKMLAKQMMQREGPQLLEQLRNAEHDVLSKNRQNDTNLILQDEPFVFAAQLVEKLPKCAEKAFLTELLKKKQNHQLLATELLKFMSDQIFDHNYDNHGLIGGNGRALRRTKRDDIDDFIKLICCGVVLAIVIVLLLMTPFGYFVLIFCLLWAYVWAYGQDH